jgi:predicted nucleotide-binding protein (sugar kinase/HSP70/actin superfamily)
MMDITVGLPRALLFHKYVDLWSAFFEALDVETVLSPPSNKAILERGSRLAVDETCLPVKLFLGHVDALRSKADVVLVPRIASLTKDEPACVKFMGAYDVARNSVPDLELIEYDVDVRNGKREGPEIRRLGRRFEPNRLKVAYAYAQARTAAERRQRAHAQEQELAAHGPGLKVLVVGHPYNVEDALIGGPVVSFLRDLGAVPIVAEIADVSRARLLSSRLSTDIPWTYNKELLGAVEHFRPHVDGMVFLVSFPCGPDSLMTELCVRRLKGVPNLVLILDELQGEAGLRTRLESFVDLLHLAAARDNRDAAQTVGADA